MKRLALVAFGLACLLTGARAEYPVARPARPVAAPAEGYYSVFPARERQRIAGLGFEIQCDSIASGNRSLPDASTSVPHDLTPAERARLYREMLQGFRYCRLAGGLYWRGLDAEGKQFQERWPGQMAELQEMIRAAGIEGVSLEYWSPAPFWKANGQLTGQNGKAQLRCFGPNFAHDPVYHGDRARFLKDFAEACRQDLQYLRAHNIPIRMWGLQNEPGASDRLQYSCCGYSPDDYSITFKAVAPVIRAFDSKIQILADSWQLAHIAPVLKDPMAARLVDALVVHQVGDDSKNVKAKTMLGAVHGFADKPRFQNEYEYLEGPASPARCLNTVQNIMNWFQIAEAPTWFWIHALKPVGHTEASGYALGFWQPATAEVPADGLQPGHWTWNPYNWHAVGSFLRHLPWDCRAVELKEAAPDPDLRLFAFKRPNGKLTVVLSNRSFSRHTFHIATGIPDATFKGCRYTPDDAGTDCQGIDLGSLKGETISPTVADLTWEFWEQQ